MPVIEPIFYSVKDATSGEIRKFIQRPIVPAQMRQLANLFKDSSNLSALISLDAENIDLSQILSFLTASPVISNFLAIIVSEEDKHLKDKDLASLSEFFEYNAPADFVVEAIKNFFVISNISEMFKNVSTSVNQMLPDSKS